MATRFPAGVSQMMLRSRVPRRKSRARSKCTMREVAAVKGSSSTKSRMILASVTLTMV